MDILNSLLIGVFGMSVVFLVLVVLILLINVQTLVARKLMSGGAPRPPRESAEAVVPSPAPPAADPQSLTLVGVDERTAALVMAIVCDKTGIPPEELYFHSIRALDDPSSVQPGRSTPA
jgi:sodium pump decarboxylase gamma subunit